jgi:hypothetical protein
MNTRRNFLFCTIVAIITGPGVCPGRPRPPFPPTPPDRTVRLELRFDSLPWQEVASPAPLVVVNVNPVESWSGWAAELTTVPALLRLPGLDTRGRPTLDGQTGCVELWFSPAWNTGEGPGTFGRLIELATAKADRQGRSWVLYCSPDGTRLFLSGQIGAQLVDYVEAPIADWKAGNWYHLVLNYSSSETALFVNGKMSGRGSGLTTVPEAKVLAAEGFCVGSSPDGVNVIAGAFDEVRILAAPMSPEQIAARYSTLAPLAALGPITPEEDAAWLAWVTWLKSPEGRSQMLILSPPPPPGGGGGGGGDTNEPPVFPPPAWANGCTNGTALIPTWLTNSTLRLEVCGRPEGLNFDLFTTTNLLNAGTVWAWLAEWPSNQNEVILTNVTDPLRFFRLREVPDLDGDGLRDFLYPEQQGLGFVADDDNDNDGIPNAIEAAWGSETNNPGSLPPPSYYVSASAPAGGDGSKDLPFRRIQTALTNATNFSVIRVLPGVYSNANDRNLSFGSTKAVLVSERGWEQTLIDCGDGTNRAFAFTSTNQDYRVQIIGFTITNAGASAVLCSAGSSPTFVHCAFVRNTNTGPGGAVWVSNAGPTLLNCRFTANVANNDRGAALFASGSDAHLRVSHCTFSNNRRATNGGQLALTNGARLTLNNCIVWSTTNLATQGTEIVTTGAGTVQVTYSDARDWGGGGTGNLNVDPDFDPDGSRRLTVNSPCLDQGTTNSVPGFHLFTRYDMDGEARTSRLGSTNAVADIGADEFVYRLMFGAVQETRSQLDSAGNVVLVTNTVSQVDEASGVANLGNDSQGRPVIAVIDDEQEEQFFLFTLNTNGVAIDATNSIPLLNLGYTDADRQVLDLEGITYDPTNRDLYLITSNTKARKYRGVEHTLLDPLVLAPTNDYDRRRNVLVKLRANSNLDAPGVNTNATRFYEPENVEFPNNVYTNAQRGLLAYIRQSMTTAPYTPQPLGTSLLIAWSETNKFGTPANGTAYSSGQAIPGGGTVLGSFALGTSQATHSNLTAGRIYHYKSWIIGPGNVYLELLSTSGVTRGYPTIFINELVADTTGSNWDWVELFNPTPVPASLYGYAMHRIPSNAQPFSAGTKISVFVNSPPSIPANGYLRVYAVNSEPSSGIYLNFALPQEGAQVSLTTGDLTNVIDWWVYGNQRNDQSEGRAWDGGPSGKVPMPVQSMRTNVATKYEEVGEPLLPTTPEAANHSGQRNSLLAASGTNATLLYLSWRFRTNSLAVWDYSPKDHDNHPVNIEAIAYRNPTEMVIGLRSPLSVDRRTGNALYYKVSNVTNFLPAAGGWSGAATSVSGPLSLDLGGKGFRSIEWFPGLGTNGTGRYLIIAGPANGGPLEKETVGEKFSLYSWDGVNAPVVLIADLRTYAVRPEGLALIVIGSQCRILFVEDRYWASGYGVRNAVHWPLSVLGAVP